MHIKMSHKTDTDTTAAEESEVKEEEETKDSEEATENTEKDTNDPVEIITQVQEDTTTEKVEVKEEKIEVEEKVKPPKKRLRRKSPVKKQEEYEGTFYTKEELAVSKLENHHLFYDDSVTCAANADPNEELENCPNCERKFVSYFSMMRHFAFFHRPEKTASIMKLKPIPRNTNEIK